uniref:GLOBIN domain-containing protein n=1 Tax=Globodera pallida TaxID=36090 RepID=A0A183BWH3_GLOPA
MTTDRRWKEKNARTLPSTSVVPQYSATNLPSLTVPDQQKKNWTSEANMQGHKRPTDKTEHYITASSEELLGYEMAKNGTIFGQIFKKIQKQGIDVFGHNLFETDQNEEQSVKRGEILFFFMKFYNKLVKLLEHGDSGTDKNTTELRIGLHKWISAAKECVAGEFQQFFKMCVRTPIPFSQLFLH